MRVFIFLPVLHEGPALPWGCGEEGHFTCMRHIAKSVAGRFGLLSLLPLKFSSENSFRPKWRNDSCNLPSRRRVHRSPAGEKRLCWEVKSASSTIHHSRLENRS
jgi:hypothetical protein